MTRSDTAQRDAAPGEPGAPADRRRTHVLVATFGSAGDMYPFLRIARDLAARGHRVTLMGPAVHADMARAAGVAFLGLGTEADYLAVIEHPDVWHPRKGFGVLWGGLRQGFAMLDEIVATFPPGEHYAMLAHPLAMPLAALVRVSRPELRLVTAWLAPANLRTVHDPLTIGPLPVPAWVPHAWRRWFWRHVDARLIDPVALPDLNAARRRLGLQPVAHFLGHVAEVGEAHVTLFPAWFAPTPPDWPRPLVEGTFPLYDPHPDASLAPELDAFLRAGDPPLVFTPGSAHRQAAAWFERALDAARRVGRRAVLLTRQRGQVPANLPAGTFWAPYVPLRALLPRAAALVHHGGIGTTAEALRAGVPQLILPFAYDQFDNGARVAALSAGRWLPSTRATPRRLAKALRALLDSPAVRDGCARTARLCARDAGVETAVLVEALLGLDVDDAPSA